ncbi:hypothetical protein [Streptomyces lichenis]|uniref:Uncharacterized protein n=1 Tax=Streptomyces lichenis TaxID=2306967 RepID=A0ABT0IFV3_9ACTN|nr:hypothetical protein [Streptomyces lichenis]MCK8680212.1 hypothetical protein [Streptomyces lichenis]
MTGPGGCTDDVAEKILSSAVNAQLNAALVWKPKSVRRGGRPSQFEGVAPIRSDLSDRFDLIFRVKVDLAWEYTLILRHISSGANIRRLDVRGTHRDRAGEDYICRTHKHRWSEARADKDVYAPTDIRHDPDVPQDVSLTAMEVEYRQVVLDFMSECNIEVGTGYAWSSPPVLPETLPVEGWEEYP